MNRRATIPFLLLLTSLAANTDAGVIDYHVDADTPAAPGAADGLSWATALPAHARSAPGTKRQRPVSSVRGNSA